MIMPVEEKCIYCNKPITPEQSTKNGGYCSEVHNYKHFEEVMNDSRAMWDDEDDY